MSSSDLLAQVNWTKYPGECDVSMVLAPYVLRENGHYKMWYTECATSIVLNRIGYATSPDGINWDRLDNLIFEVGIQLWEAGDYFSDIRVGLVTSIDWINWTKYCDIPVIKPSKSGWDNGGVESGSLVMIGDSLKMLYDDANFVASTWQIGFAKSLFKPVSVGQEIIMPTEFTLKQNYRIAFKPSTQISWESPISKHWRIYDVLGNEVATLFNEEKPADNYELPWNALSLSSGVYFYQLKAGDFMLVKIMILPR